MSENIPQISDLGRKYFRIFVLGHLFLEAHSFSRKTVRFSEPTMSTDKYPSIFSRQTEAILYIFLNFRARCEKDLKDYKLNSFHSGQKYALIFTLRHYLFLKAQFSSSYILGKNIRFSEQIMSADKYPCMFSHQMEVIVYLFL